MALDKYIGEITLNSEIAIRGSCLSIRFRNLSAIAFRGTEFNILINRYFIFDI